MTVQTINYADNATMLIGVSRSSTLHDTGFRAMRITKLPNGTYDVLFDNKIDVTPPKRQLTESQYLREKAASENIDIV